MSTESTPKAPAKAKGRKRLTEEEKAARQAAADEKKRIALEKKAAKYAADESKRELKAAREELKRQQDELRAMSLMEDNKQKCELIRQYTARMKAIAERKANSVNLRQSMAFDRPVNIRRGVEVPGALRSPPGKDVIYEDTVGLPRASPSQSVEEDDQSLETDEEEAQLEEVDWDDIELPNIN